MKSSHLVFDIEDDILLIFFFLVPLLTSLDITLDDGASVAEARAQSAHDGRRVFKKKGCEIERDKHEVLYMKSDTTPVWLHSSQQKCVTPAAECVSDKSWSDSGDRKQKNRSEEGFCASKASFIASLSHQSSLNLFHPPCLSDSCLGISLDNL